MDDILISTDNKGGRAYLTTSSPVSHYGIPILRIEAEDIDGDFGPSDIIDGTMTAADIIVGWAKRPGRTNDELIAARKFLGQWPEGPQLHGGKRPGSGRVPSGRKTRNYYLTDAENNLVKDYINKMREEQKNMIPSQYYETTGDSLKGDQQIRAYRAAQKHLDCTADTYIDDFKRIQDKIIGALEARLEVKIKRDLSFED